jgi:hypothetical protein
VSLLPQVKLADDLLVFRRVFVLQVSEESPAFSYQNQETATGMEVLFMELEVFRQKSDPLGQKRYLHLRRAGVLTMYLEVVDDLFFIISK